MLRCFDLAGLIKSIASAGGDFVSDVLQRYQIRSGYANVLVLGTNIPVVKRRPAN